MVDGFTYGLVTKAGLSSFTECYAEVTSVDEIVKIARTDFKIHDAEAGFKELMLAFRMVPEVFEVCENCKPDISRIVSWLSILTNPDAASIISANLANSSDMVDQYLRDVWQCILYGRYFEIGLDFSDLVLIALGPVP